MSFASEPARDFIDVYEDGWILAEYHLDDTWHQLIHPCVKYDKLSTAEFARKRYFGCTDFGRERLRLIVPMTPHEFRIFKQDTQHKEKPLECSFTIIGAQ